MVHRKGARTVDWQAELLQALLWVFLLHVCWLLPWPLCCSGAARGVLWDQGKSSDSSVAFVIADVCCGFVLTWQSQQTQRPHSHLGCLACWVATTGMQYTYAQLHCYALSPKLPQHAERTRVEHDDYDDVHSLDILHLCGAKLSHCCYA